ncbi:MAG: hypothetical protein NT066_07065 [Candidatus Omnitrophica bacterium]|nr:hypothetical protein [Candidatus Omnitrophota bacterium]
MLIYLDTSFISNFAKAELADSVTSDTKNWKALLNCLRQRINENKLLCPASQFQTYEAQLNSRLLPKFKQIQMELSQGIWLKGFDEILVHQTANQLLVYFDRKQDINLHWKVITDRKPTRIDSQFIRTAKAYAKEISDYLAPAAKDFKEQYQREKTSFVQKVFLQELEQITSLDALISRFSVGLLGMSMRQADIPISKKELKSVVNFLETDLVDNIDFIHLFCSITASIVRNRPYKPGDLFDVAHLSCAIPYCKIITTDTDMKTTVQGRLKIKDVEVFSPTSEDINAFLKRIGE